MSAARSVFALYSAMRRWLSDPARREGMLSQMCSTWARTLSADSAARISFSDIDGSSGRDANSSVSA
jgi:hypothetical protein